MLGARVAVPLRVLCRDTVVFVLGLLYCFLGLVILVDVVHDGQPCSEIAVQLARGQYW